MDPIPYPLATPAGDTAPVALLCIGMMLALSAYNLSIFAGSRDRTYLWYSLSIGCSTVVWCSYFGLLSALVGYHEPADHLAALAELAACLFALLFTREFLDLAGELPVLDRLYAWTTALVACTMGLFPFVQDYLPFPVYWPSMLPVMLLMLGSSIWRIRAGYRAARLVIAGYGLITLVLFLAVLRALHVIPYDAQQPLLFTGASTVGMLLLGLAMADRARQWHKARPTPDPASASRNLLAALSHELRTPLTCLLSIIRLLGNTPLDATQRKLVATLGHSSDDLLSLLDNTLDYSRHAQHSTPTIHPQDFSLSLLVANLMQLMTARAAEKGLIASAQIDPALPDLLCGDANRIRQILTNLLGNAIKFTPGGIVKLLVEHSGHPDDALQGHVPLCFVVIDSGIGIASELQERIFLPFHQAPDVQGHYGGSGLGLNISRELARAMGGDITVSSQPGRGSTFRFSLVLPASQPARPAAGQKISPGTISQADILVIS